MNHQAYLDWLTDVDAVSFRATGLTLDELPDYEFHTAYEDGETPEDVLDDILREAGGGESFT